MLEFHYYGNFWTFFPSTIHFRSYVISIFGHRVFFLSLSTNSPFVSICFLHSLRMCSNFAFFPFITQKQECSQWLDMFFYVMCACIRFEKKKANFHNMVVRFWICVFGMCSIVCPISSKVHNHHKMTKLSRNMEQSARMAWTSIVTKRKH